MASSKKSRRRDLRAHVAGLLAKNIKQHLVLGLSGGLDSMVLLDILKALSGKLHFKFSALHVNHQLSLNAASWAEFCRRECLRRAIPLQIVKVKVSGARGLGVEAAARTARYQAYREQKAHTIVLAHHLDDQAETLLLQLLRGGGIKGLSAMPEARSESSGLRILRLLLEVPRSEIKHYAQTRKLKWIEDESNDDTRFDRNFLRHEVLPVMAKHFPVYRETLGRVSRHFAEAAQLLDELGKLDFSANNHQGRLRAAALRELAPARAKNLLRHYLAQNQVAMPGAKKLDEILQQLAHARSDANVKVNLGEWELRRFKGEVYVERAQGGGSKIDIEWHGELRLVLSQNGMLVFRRTQGKGIAYARLIRNPVHVRLRRGGEKFRLDLKRPRRSLKNLLQESKIPPWQRARLPLLYSGEDLVWVPGIGIDCAYQAQPAEAGLAVSWKVHYADSNKAGGFPEP